MNYLRLIGLVASVGLLANCESTDTAGKPGNAEKREMARRAAAEQQGPQDEAQRNLWNAQHDIINRDSNPMRGN